MKRKICLLVILACGAAFSSDGPKGTAPHASAAGYAVHSERDGASIGATLLTAKEARRVFVSDVNRCCLVVEVAFYPPKEKPLELSLNDFVLKVGGADISAKPASPKVVAASLRKKAGSGRDITVTPIAGVGYESAGYDPVTGTRTGGRIYQSGVAVSTGNSGPKPGSTEKDRSAMEAELGEKGLPEGITSAPVAGYLYFPLTGKTRKAAHQLEYQLNGTPVVLSLP